MKKCRIPAYFMILAMAGSSLAGCGNSASDASEPAGGQADTEKGSDQKESLPGEKETLVVGMQTSSFVTDYEDNYLTKLLEEELNINIEMYELPSSGSDIQSKISLMATNGEDMPDIFITTALSTEQILEYGSKGVFIPLNSYLEQEGTNYAALPQEHRERIETSITSADGNIYGLFGFSENAWNDTPHRTFINSAWLDKLGLEVPETTDELYEVLKAFSEGDPNGNGMADELGAYGYTAGGYGEDIVDTLMNAFVFYNGGGTNGGLALDESGETVTAPFATEEWREGLRYMKKLYDEGLLASAVFTDDSNQFKATLNAENNVVGLVSAGSTSNWTDCDNNANFLEMEMIPPLTGPEGVCYTPYSVYEPVQKFFVTSSCANPDLAFALGDWFLTVEHSRMGRYGEKEVDWTDDPEICKANTNAYVEAGLLDQVECVYLTNIWSEPSNKFWYNNNPYYAPMEHGEQCVASGVTPYDETSKSAMLPAYNMEWYADKHPEAMLSSLHYTEEETEACKEIIMNVKEFVEQTKAEFITGARDLDGGWDAYLDELDTMGLKQWMETAQKAYERGKR